MLKGGRLSFSDDLVNIKLTKNSVSPGCFLVQNQEDVQSVRPHPHSAPGPPEPQTQEKYQQEAGTCCQGKFDTILY